MNIDRTSPQGGVSWLGHLTPNTTPSIIQKKNQSDPDKGQPYMIGWLKTGASDRESMYNSRKNVFILLQIVAALKKSKERRGA